jgi:hypothetical protein
MLLLVSSGFWATLCTYSCPKYVARMHTDKKRLVRPGLSEVPICSQLYVAIVGLYGLPLFFQVLCGQESGSYFWISKKKSMLDVKGQETVICIRRLPQSRYVELLMRDHFVPRLKNPPVCHRTIERAILPGCSDIHWLPCFISFEDLVKKYSFFRLWSSGCLHHAVYVPKYSTPTNVLIVQHILV